MSIKKIVAWFACDGCGTTFSIDLDNASSTTSYLPSLTELAEDHVRGGEATNEGGFASIQAGMHLCNLCSNKADAIGDDEHEPTREEILKAVGAT